MQLCLITAPLTPASQLHFISRGDRQLPFLQLNSNSTWVGLRQHRIPDTWCRNVRTYRYGCEKKIICVVFFVFCFLFFVFCFLFFVFCFLFFVFCFLFFVFCFLFFVFCFLFLVFCFLFFVFCFFFFFFCFLFFVF